MRYNDNRLFPRIRDRMREWIHPDEHIDASLKDQTILDTEDDDDTLTWRQYIL